MNAALKRVEEVEHAQSLLLKMNLVPHKTKEKNWDLWHFTSRLSGLNPRANILDVGCIGNPFLDNMAALGFKSLWGIDLGEVPNTLDFNGPIHFFRQDLTQTTFEYQFFDAVTSLSVVEHGVDPNAYFAEMSRILKPGGLLLTSTDYWSEPVSTRGISKKKRFGLPWKVQTPDDIRGMIKTAAKWGLKPTGPIDFTVQNKVVHWEGKQYTFFAFALQKV